jgi:hypothetical protein
VDHLLVRLFTAGHGNRSTDDLVALVQSADVTRLVDIRRYRGDEAGLSATPRFGSEFGLLEPDI